MPTTALKRAAQLAVKSPAAKKSTQLRSIARLPFKGALPAKDVDKAIKAVMARRNAKARKAVAIVATVRSAASAKAVK